MIQITRIKVTKDTNPEDLKKKLRDLGFDPSRKLTDNDRKEMREFARQQGWEEVK